MDLEKLKQQSPVLSDDDTPFELAPSKTIVVTVHLCDLVYMNTDYKSVIDFHKIIYPVYMSPTVKDYFVDLTPAAEKIVTELQIERIYAQESRFKTMFGQFRAALRDTPKSLRTQTISFNLMSVVESMKATEHTLKAVYLPYLQVKASSMNVEASLVFLMPEEELNVSV